MLITAIKYANETGTQLEVTTSDMGVMNVPQPCETWHKAEIDKWVADGGVIGAWVDPVNYMNKMRQDRDQKIAAIYWRVERNQTQLAGGITPTDNESKMGDIYDYLQDLRDFPAANPIATKAEYEALVWPTAPA